MKSFKSYVLSAFAIMLIVPTITNAYGSGGSFFVPTSVPKVVAPVANLTTTQPIGKVLGAESYTFTKRLANGNRSDAVTQLQKLLNEKGFNCGKVDGIFGKNTKAGVIKFQIANGLIPDGIVGPQTNALLNK